MTGGSSKETVLKGLPLSTGIAIGRVCRFNRNRRGNVEMQRVEGRGVQREVERFRNAARIARDHIERIRQQTRRKIGTAEAEIFGAQKMILADKGLHDKIIGLMRQKNLNAESAVTAILDTYEKRIRELDDEYIRDRSSDIGEIKRRLLDVLSGITPEFQCVGGADCQRGRARIVVTDELTPAMTMELEADQTMGFVTERGGKNSHAAILARALGIPAVSGIPYAHRDILCGTEIVVNGHSGEVVVWPSEKTILNAKQSGLAVRMPRAVGAVPGFEVMANISLSSEAEDAVKMRAEGVGLYRTEFEFMEAGRLLSEDTQCRLYSSVVRALDGLPATFRLFDGGGDKRMDFLDLAAERNPALGWRGSRLLLGHSDLFGAQSRAIARASRLGPVRVMYPMVVDAAQFKQLRNAFSRATAKIAKGRIEHGVMFEVPSACLQARELLEAADFGSIGTNDLIQYLFAVDRDNERVASDYSPERPVLWQVIRSVADAAKSAKKTVSVCGELAGDPAYVSKLFAAGIRSVSVSVRLIPGIRLAAKALLEHGKDGHAPARASKGTIRA